MRFVFDLSFCQRGSAMNAPVDRFLALVDHPLFDELSERANDRGLVSVVHRQVRLRPQAGHSEPFELLSLDLDVLCRVLPARATEIGDAHVALLRSELAIDFQLDRQTMAVPSRYIGRVEPRHRPRADDEVLEDLVERVPDVDASVGVRRAVVQDELRLARATLSDLAVEIHLLPSREPFGLRRLQVRFHRESCPRQVDRILPLGHVSLDSIMS